MNTFGTGAFHREDKRDYIFGAAGSESFDWEKGYETDISDVEIRNQNGSLSCVAQSTVAMVDILTGMKKSAHYVYSQIFLSNGGAFMKDGIDIGSKQLIAFEKDFPSYPADEASLRDKKGLNIRLDPIPDTYASISVNIDSIAQAIRDNKCAMIGAEGSNDGWNNPDIEFIKNDWGHAVCAVGAVMRNGKKAIKFLNSWSKFWGDNGCGYINEDYFNKDAIMAAFVYTNNFFKPNEDAMEYLLNNENKLVQNAETGEIGLIKGKEVLVTSSGRAGLLALTHIIRNGGGGAVPKELWNDFPKKSF